MDFVFVLTDISLKDYLIACSTGILVTLLWGKKASWKSGIAAGLAVLWYMLVLFATIGIREPFEGEHINLQLFRTYRIHSKFLMRQALINLLLLMPGGMLIPMLGILKLRDVAVIGFLESLVIEILQFITKTGLFELDDLFHNTAGVVIGWGIWKVICITMKNNKAC